MKNDTAPKTISSGQMKELAAAILEGIPTDLPFKLAEKWIGKKGKLHQGVKELLFDKEILEIFFDHHGRRIPKDLQVNICDFNPNFCLEQPSMTKKSNFANRLLRLEGCLSVETGITAQQFQQKTERLIGLIRSNPQISNIAKGVWLPLVLPKLIVTDDLGAELGNLLVAVNNSYSKTFGNRKFNNYRRGNLANKVSIVDLSRHEKLIERLKQGPAIGIHFPNPLQGFSVKASREQMATLSERFVLSGLDTVIAMIMYSDILARDFNTPSLDLAAFSWRSDGSLFFDAGDDGLGFGGRGHLGHASARCSSGLLFLGECL